MKNTESKISDPSKEDIRKFNEDISYVSAAHDNLLKKLFGFVPENPGDYFIERKAYTKAMKEVQQEFQLEEGDPRLVLFVLEQLSRSPRFIDSPKASEKNKNKKRR